MEALASEVQSAHDDTSAFATLNGGKIEFNICETGLHIVANEDGWRSLGSWCERMASREEDVCDSDGHHHTSYELDPDIAPEDMIVNGSVITSFWGLGANLDADMDVHLHISAVVGPDYWKGMGVKSGNSPGTHAFATQMYWALDGLREITIESAMARLGEPVAEDGNLMYFRPDELVHKMVPQFSFADMFIELDIEKGRVDRANWISRSELDALVGERG